VKHERERKRRPSQSRKESILNCLFMEGQCFIYTEKVGGQIKVIGSRNKGPLRGGNGPLKRGQKNGGE